MLLRPTESLTVYLQQLGRGLRLHDEKSHLTVLDFIAPQHRQFRFADRFRALSSRAEVRVDRQVEAGFPWLPAGCLVRLDKKASEVVLENIRDALVQRRPQIIQHLTRMRDQVNGQPSLKQMMDWLHFDDADLLLKHGLPCRLLEQAGGPSVGELGDYEKGLALGTRHLLIADDRDLLKTLFEALQGKITAECDWKQRLTLALALVWGQNRPSGGEAAALAFLRDNTALKRDLEQVIEYRLGQLLPIEPRRFPRVSGALALHSHYTREQILLALGKGDFEKPFSHREGVLHLPDDQLDAFFVTVNKSDKDFSPSTLYEDYALNEQLFHWQSQSMTTPESPTGQRYINHADMGYQPLLFVRGAKNLPNGLTAPFQYLGPAEFVRHQGSKPMSIVWRLRHPLQAKSLRQYRREAV